MEFSGGGICGIKTSASKEKLQEVINIITAEVRRVIQHGLDDTEIQFAKDKIAKSKRMELQSSSSWVNFHAHPQLLSQTPWTLIDYLREIEKVSNDDIKRVAEKYFSSDKWYLALCGDITEAPSVNL
jgi:predicted Zn-dependent peptidase